MTEEIYEKKAGNGCVAELYFEGRMTRRQLEFLTESVKKYKINKTTLNRSGNVVVWNLRREVLRDFLAEAGEAELVCGSAYMPEKISVGCQVKVYDVEYEEEIEFRIVGSTEANSLENKISNESPVGKALLGRKAGETVEVETQAGVIEYKILEIQRVQ